MCCFYVDFSFFFFGLDGSVNFFLFDRMIVAVNILLGAVVVGIVDAVDDARRRAMVVAAAAAVRAAYAAGRVINDVRAS